MTLTPARRTALQALERIRREQAFSGAVLAGLLPRSGLSSADVALVTRLVYGTLATEGVLDELIDRFARGDLEPRVRDRLRLGAYEILYTRAPAFAVVDQTVDAVRVVRPQAAPLANAVMRRIAEAAVEFPFGDVTSDRDALARATGTPRWIVDVFVASLGEEHGRIALEAGLEPAPTYVRLDPFAADPAVTERMLSESDAEPVPSPPDPDTRLLGHPAAAFRNAAAVPGWFPMDAAAQVAPLAVTPSAGESVADVGAGRGNKTVCLQAAAVRSGGPARITAIDRHPGKMARLQGRMRESSVPEVTAVVADVTTPGWADELGGFDAVLIDAPCTGLGTLRRYPEKRWRLMPQDLRRMADLQLTMLRRVAPAVRPGGRLVYATCSVARAENGDVLDAFAQTPEGRGFAAERIDALVPAEWQAFIDEAGRFRSWPMPGGPDGHFVARLRRTG